MEQVIVAVIGAAAVMLAAIVSGPASARSARAKLEKDLEIYNALPVTSPAKAIQLELVEKQVSALAGTAGWKRSPGQVVLAILILALAAGGAWVAVVLGGWWWLLSPVALFLMLLGGVGLGLGLTKGPRDASGKLIR